LQSRSHVPPGTDAAGSANWAAGERPVPGGPDAYTLDTPSNAEHKENDAWEGSC